MSMTISAVLPADERERRRLGGHFDGLAHMCSSTVFANADLALISRSGRFAWLVENPRGERQHGVVGQCGAQQHRAVGPAVGCGAERDRDAEQVEQVAEVRVVAEHRVAVDRARQHLVDGEGGADRGNHQHVHVSATAGRRLP